MSEYRIEVDFGQQGYVEYGNMAKIIKIIHKESATAKVTITKVVS